MFELNVKRYNLDSNLEYNLVLRCQQILIIQIVFVDLQSIIKQLHHASCGKKASVHTRVTAAF